MKQPIVARIIEFPLKLTMANTCNIFAAVVLLASLSLSSASVNQDFGISKEDFQKNFDLKLQPFLREKREEDAYLVKKHDSIESEELTESQTIHNRRAIAEEINKSNDKDDRKNEEPKTNNNIEENAKDEVYRNMHDLIQAFILADEQDIATRLQQLREMENATESETLSNLPKRHASAGNYLGANLFEPVALTDLDAHSCEDEAFGHGHGHLAALVVHELSCELRKSVHYSLIVARNLREGLSFGPLIVEEGVIGHSILGRLFHHILRILRTVIREPHHLLILPDIIRDAIPFPSIRHALHRLVRVFFKVIHFVREFLWEHIRLVFGRFFHLGVHHIGARLRERLLGHIALANLHYPHGLDLTGDLPFGEEIVGGPIVSTATSAAAAAAAAATAADGDAIVVPDYRSSLAELLASFRGIYDGYYASGLPHLIRTGVKSISTSSVYSKVTSYLSNVPSYLSNVPSYLSNLGSYLSGIPFLNCNNGYAPLEQGTTVTATSTSSVSSSVGGPIVNPVSPIISPALAPVETVSSSASASATVAETEPVISAAPFYSGVPNYVSSVPVIPSSGAASAAATAAAASAAASASAASASPVVSSYPIAPQYEVPCAPVVEPVISETIENTVSESSSSSVAVASPEVVIPGGSVENAAAAASASASASSASDINPAINAGPLYNLPYSLNRYRSRPVFSAARPASAASASSSASVSSGGSLIQPDQYRGYDLNFDRRIPLVRPQYYPAAFPSVGPSSAAATAAAASSEGAAAASSASSISSGGLNFVLPREHIVGALGHDYLSPGDLISIALRNKAILIGRVLDATSPISFNFLRPKFRASLFRHGGRVWNLSARDFRDPECVRRLNSPLLLRYAL